MTLGKLLRSKAEPLRDVQKTYKENVVNVNNALTATLSTTLPTLTFQPDDWPEFISKFGDAKRASLAWVNSVLARLSENPKSISSYQSVIKSLLQASASQADILKSNKDPNLQELLTKNLDNISSQMNVVSVVIQGTVEQISKFANVLPSIAGDLQSLADSASKDEKIDKQKIEDLKTDIQNLRDEIKSLQADLVGLGIADGIAVTLGVATSIVLFPEGLVSWLALGPAVAVASTYIQLDRNQINADKQEIDAKSHEMDERTQDVAVLSTLAQHMSVLAAQTQAVQGSLDDILNEWTILENDMNAELADIKDAIAKNTAEDYAAVETDLNDAILEWDVVITQSTSLEIDINVNNADIKVGMSADDVKDALAQGQSFTAVQYYNQVSFEDFDAIRADAQAKLDEQNHS